MLKIIWIVDAVLLVIAFSLAVFASGQDAAGKGVIWMFFVIFAAALAGSWVANRMGRPTSATVIGLSGVVIGLIIAGVFARSIQRERSQLFGSEYWTDPLQRRLADAIAHDDTTKMREAIAAGANINAVGEESTTPLTFAVRQRPDVVGTVLKLGADPNLVLENVLSPLAIAINLPDPAFQLLLDGGADPNGPGEYQSSLIIFTAIESQYARRYDALVAHGADVKRLDGEGRTTLMVAAQSRQWKIALDLLSRGVDPKIVANNGATVSTIVERMHESSRDDADYQQFVAKLRAP